MIYLHKPNTSKKEIQNIIECFKQNKLAFGSYIDRFEDSIKKLIKVKYAVACVNGTSALQIAIRLLNLEANDEIIVPSLTFISPVNAIRYNNLNPVFMDSDNNFNIDQNKTIKFLKQNTVQILDKKKNILVTLNKKTKKRIGAIIIVHTFGNPCNINLLLPLCKKLNIKIIEDNAESLGAYYKEGKLKNKYTGSIGDIGILSFNGNKIITAGGGGMIISNKKSYILRARYLINQAKDNSPEFIHNEIGYNFRLSNIHAAIGYTQTSKLNSFIRKKKQIHKIYKKKLNKSKYINLIEPSDSISSNFWLNIINIDFENIEINKITVIKKMKKRNIELRPIWHLNHLQKPYKNYQNYQIVNSPKIIKNCLCLPSSSDLNKNQINIISKELLKIVK